MTTACRLAPEAGRQVEQEQDCGGDQAERRAAALA